jgi:signal transduction histidine kinase
MDRLIGDLLDTAAIDAGRLSLDRHAHRAVDLAIEAVEAAKTLAPERAISLEASLHEEASWVLCDHDRIVQVLTNLLGNALKHTPPEASIVVRITSEGGMCRFEVRDSGPGIPAEHLGKIFDRFWRARARRDGAGLGLHIAKGIVEAHGGRIGVESQPEQGSAFFFTVPVAAGEG